MPRHRRIGFWPALMGLGLGVLVLGVGMGVGQALAQQAAPMVPFVYRSGPQGVGYYPAPALVAPAGAVAPAPAPAPRTVGPGARNFSTGNRIPLHRPWLRARR